MDSIGLVATHIDEEGFIHVGAVGGVAPLRVLHTPVRFQNGTCGVVCAPDGRLSLPSSRLADLLIDIGAARQG